MTHPPRIRCPCCGAGLEWPVRDSARIECGCGAGFASCAGIPVFRGSEDPYHGNRRDDEIAADLLDHFDSLSFERLLARYFQRHCPELGPADVRRQMRHIIDGPHRSATDCSRTPNFDPEPILDLGCGSGSALVALAVTVSPLSLIGSDIAMRWLVLARKRLDELGLGDIRLICCEGEAMPVFDGTFSAVMGGDVIEHVADAEAVLAETGRVLRPGGRARFRTPNRMSLTPEPHVGLPFAGWLPPNLANRYCRLLGAPPYQGIFTRTRSGWNRAARNVMELRPTVEIDVIPARVGFGDRRHSRFVRLYDEALNHSRVFRSFAAWFGPVLEIRMEKRIEPPEAPAGPFGEAPGGEQGDGPE